jgi:tetratricopeptide (TPR) repeat protein
MLETVHLARYNLLLTIFLLQFYSIIIPQVYPDDKVDLLMKEGITCIINQDYSGAEVFFNSLNKTYPELPLGKIYLAAVSIAKSYDYAEQFDESNILGLLDDAKDQAEQLLEEDKSNIWNLYFLALAEGYTAYFDAINESWLSAVTKGMSSISLFEDILEIDTSFYEAYIAIGTFEYWKSRKMEFMDWLPFVNDNKKFGIEQLEIAIDSSTYNSYLAINSLIWIYIDQKNYSAAISVAENALKKFPISRTFKWGMARAYEEINPRLSIQLYSEILKSYPNGTLNNHINEITLKHIIAQQYIKLEEKKEALKICNEILAVNNLSERSKEILESRLERVKILKNELVSNR